MKKTVILFIIAIMLSSFLLYGCSAMKGVNVGGVDLTPLASAGEKLSQRGETPENEEVVIGGHMAGTLLGASKLDPKVNTQRYVNRVGRWLSLHCSRPNLPWRFGVLADNDLNAFAAPGGYVFITRGLLNILDNEAELAGVLSHEMGHVNCKHYLAAVRSNNLVGAAMDVGLFLGDAATSGSASAQQREFGQKVVNASREVYAKGLDKDDEYEADHEALKLMTAAGYDPYAYVAVIQKIEARSANDSGLALLLQTHPRPEDRLNEMDEVLSDMTLSQNPATLKDRFRNELKR